MHWVSDWRCIVDLIEQNIIEYVQLNLTKVATLEEKVRNHVREMEKSLRTPHLPEGKGDKKN